MLFSSYSFILYFFPACFLLSLLFRRFSNFKYHVLLLIAASLVFYAFGNVYYLILILGSIGFNYSMAKVITGHQDRKKLFLWLGVGANIALLTYYKYTNFFVETFNQITDGSVLYNVVLPIGISFYTFQQIMYLVDSYKGKVEQHDFKTYVLYIAFFPQLIAGPIVCHKDFFHQLRDKSLAIDTPKNLAIGLSFFTYGLFKKIVIADQLEAAFINPVFDASMAGSVTFWEAWVGTVAYAFQIYYDFSGYSDMALGLGKCFGIELPQNFNSPYKSKSLREFWRRWHMTLSFFLRDYLYIPLGGNRVAEWRKNFNIVLTMFLAGLWHGAGWGFMIWGFLHGVGIAINHYLAKAGKLNRIPFLNWVFTFAFVCLCWVAFRSESMSSMVEMWVSMFSLIEIIETDSKLYAEFHVLILPVLLAHCVFCPNLFQIFEKDLKYVDRQVLDNCHPLLERFLVWKPTAIWAVTSACAFYASFLLMGTVNSFIYFQF